MRRFNSQNFLEFLGLAPSGLTVSSAPKNNLNHKSVHGQWLFGGVVSVSEPPLSGPTFQWLTLMVDGPSSLSLLNEK